MQLSAWVIKISTILLQYGMLIFLLYFVYKTIRFIKTDSEPLREEIYTETEISAEEGILTVIESMDDEITGRRFAFVNGISIGRAEDNDIVINDGYVSHHHARITLYNNLYVLEDCGSANKTYLNGGELTSKQYLQSGDIINIGTVTFRFGR